MKAKRVFACPDKITISNGVYFSDLVSEELEPVNAILLLTDNSSLLQPKTVAVHFSTVKKSMLRWKVPGGENTAYNTTTASFYHGVYKSKMHTHDTLCCRQYFYLLLFVESIQPVSAGGTLVKLHLQHS